MNEALHGDAQDIPQAMSPDCNALFELLRSAGAPGFDPVRWHYIEALAKRTATYDGQIRVKLEAKLADALVALQTRFELARSDAEKALAQAMQQFPQAAKDLQRHFDAGDFKTLQYLIHTQTAQQQGASLAAIVQTLEQSLQESTKANQTTPALQHPELKTLRNFRDTWSKLSMEKQLAQALAQAPKNAGPINSHMLMLRSLALMRDLSPDYFMRFMSYAETLLCLDQGESEKQDPSQKNPAGKAAKKAGRAK